VAAHARGGEVGNFECGGECVWGMVEVCEL
jgi:hypothetical protein